MSSEIHESPFTVGQRLRNHVRDVISGHGEAIPQGSTCRVVHAGRLSSVVVFDILPNRQIAISNDLLISAEPTTPGIFRGCPRCGGTLQLDSIKDLPDARPPTPPDKPPSTATNPRRPLPIRVFSLEVDPLRPQPSASIAGQAGPWAIIELRNLPAVESVELSNCGRAVFLELADCRLGCGPIPMVMIIDLRLDHPHGLWSSEILPDRQGVNLVLRRHP